MITVSKHMKNMLKNKIKHLKTIWDIVNKEINFIWNKLKIVGRMLYLIDKLYYEV